MSDKTITVTNEEWERLTQLVGLNIDLNLTPELREAMAIGNLQRTIALNDRISADRALFQKLLDA